MSKKPSFLAPYKKPLILLGVALVILLGVTKVMPLISSLNANDTPITGIKAENDTVYNINDTIAAEDFQVEAKHEDGETSVLSEDAYSISKKKPEKIGKYTEVVITLKSNKEIKDTIKVKNEREKITSFDCGSPNIKDVKAVVYSNGELAFEGKGNVLQYEREKFPWQNNRDIVISSISFEKDITPKSMDYWFEGMENLTYISPLPSTVESIVGMCNDCPVLEEGVDWSQCENLLDISGLYEDCPVMKTIPAIPSTVRNASNFCAGCEELQATPDMTKATAMTNGTEMYYNCKKLTETTSAPALVIYDSMYQNCINLKDMPEIAPTAQSMENTFADCISLATTKRIPEKVDVVTGCFSGCSKLTGDLVVDAKPNDYAGFLDGASNATILNLTGKSDRLDVLANTCEGNNIMVNGKAPNREKTSVE